MSELTALEKMKVVLRESDIPFFTDEELQLHLDEAGGDINNALYECLLIKAEDTYLKTNELMLNDSSKYFRRLASRYRPSNSGSLRV